MNLIEYLNIYLFFTQTKTRQKNKGAVRLPKHGWNVGEA